MNWEDTVISKCELEATVFSCEIDTGSIKGVMLGLLRAQAKITWDIAERKGFERAQSTVMDWLPR